jgi:hypothetical protein
MRRLNGRSPASERTPLPSLRYSDAWINSYGEQGSIIIHQSLYSLFPPDGIPPALVLPLTPDQFLTRVLVPETAVLLIQQDMSLTTKRQALRVLDESKKYGLAMFPEQAQSEEVASVGEDLARERARTRRKVLEARGEADADVRREVQREQRQASKAKGKEKEKSNAKGKGKAKVSDVESEFSLESEQEQTKGKQKAREPLQGQVVKDATTKTRHQRWDENGDVLMLAEFDESTPRPAKVANKIRESSTSSWRSHRSPSTSPAKHINSKPASQPSSLHRSSNPLTSRSRQPAEDNMQGSQWTFDLADVSTSSDREDVDFDEMIAEYQGKGRTEETISSDSDVVVIEEPTPKAKPKPRRTVKRTIQSEESASDPDSTSDVVVEKARSKSKPKPTIGKMGDEVGDEGDVRMRGVLGQTKRRKNGKSTGEARQPDGESNKHSWLLSDISD